MLNIFRSKKDFLNIVTGKAVNQYLSKSCQQNSTVELMPKLFY